MKKILKRTLYKTVGQKKYLRLLHKGFYFLFDTGSLKKEEAYQYNYFVKNIIQPGDYVADLGANLGYFAKIFSRLVGANGKVICIEPVKPFFETLRWSLGKTKNVQIYNYALGTEQKKIEMILPKSDGYFRTGLAHVPTDQAELKNDNYTFEVEMVKGSDLLKPLPRLDYIKCDIEGYEEYVLPELKEVIEKFKPYIQVETWGKHKEVVFELLTSLDFEVYGLINNKLTKQIDMATYASDFLFVHKSKEQQLTDKLKKSNSI